MPNVPESESYDHTDRNGDTQKIRHSYSFPLNKTPIRYTIRNTCGKNHETH